MPLSCKYRISVSVKVISVNWQRLGEVEPRSVSAEARMLDIC